MTLTAATVPAISSFTALPTNIPSGQSSSTLSWATSGSKQVRWNFARDIYFNQCERVHDGDPIGHNEVHADGDEWRRLWHWQQLPTVTLALAAGNAVKITSTTCPGGAAGRGLLPGCTIVAAGGLAALHVFHQHQSQLSSCAARSG